MTEQVREYEVTIEDNEMWVTVNAHSASSQTFRIQSDRLRTELGLLLMACDIIAPE